MRGRKKGLPVRRAPFFTSKSGLSLNDKADLPKLPTFPSRAPRSSPHTEPRQNKVAFPYLFHPTQARRGRRTLRRRWGCRSVVTKVINRDVQNAHVPAVTNGFWRAAEGHCGEGRAVQTKGSKCRCLWKCSIGYPINTQSIPYRYPIYRVSIGY